MAQSIKISSIGRGVPIVLLHGWGLNSGVFASLAHKLAEQFKVISVDLPGYGDNVDVMPDDYNLAGVAKLVTEAVTEPAVYLGWSLGGLVATQIARTSPQHKILGLVHVATSPYFVQSADWPGIKPELLATFHQQLSKDIGKTLSGFLKIQAMGSSHIKDDIRQIQSLVMAKPLPNKFALEKGLEILANADTRAELAEITLPFLRIYGNMDSLVPKKVINFVNELSPNSELVVFDKASHAPFISNFQLFVEQLSAWLGDNLVSGNG
ncbi:pimeloyl-[acyl-carrier protein] methyl ester esterase [Thalassotalea euphylliae]|uniref:Pimeloyl-[acyl-carrier protein] methyl ester esterase n=1 Tax=Thalassotalea euphylliae TaxID=1655234 RepID=A0A3E0TL52_9GAMM|nr:pimeloyl-ACP methyl ester esterase BioH [Thalassotalea euphylliae]REL25246.1 pimeloyl-[acyl-carrier protein] methyl ester esterase [Thalassotalea euphylliae]